MATLLLSAAGSAVGGAFGGSLAGLGTAALGKAAGAMLGSAVDQRLLGAGSAPVETGKVERFRVMGSSEGAAIPRVWGRVRVAGQLIWSSRFLEAVNSTQVGGKGGGPTVREFSYSVSLAVALCEGEVARIGRIWADGIPLDQHGIVFRLHPGNEDQQPDPLITAIEGAAPAYRGTAYLVFENLDLTPFGNRIPQFNFEVFRRPPALAGVPTSPAEAVRGVALVPGTGEYALATEQIQFLRSGGSSDVVNVHNDRGIPDLLASLDQLSADLPNVGSVSLVATWFGDDLRCGRCNLFPSVEQKIEDGDEMPWVVSGQARSAARAVSRIEGRPVFGGTPADASVIQAIHELHAGGRSVMFYPFILMDIQAGNGRADPWTGAEHQPLVPWRGRITLDRAPGQLGSTDKTAASAAEVSAFFGAAQSEDFTPSGRSVAYSGPEEWSYRRFVLHYAHLCALAGGVEAFCIGSEMRGLTQIRDGAATYPAVRELRRLAADVRSILGPATRIGYAADWSEYFGHQPADGSGDVLFHLDPLWADPDIDFVGIDNYMPLSDWREGSDHADAAVGSIYDIGYLRANVAGGEGFDWYYADAAGREGQDRLPIADGTYGEDWVFRYKDLVSWWSQAHIDRVGGIKAGASTSWVPQSKPIWFTELGCPAVDKGTNQPNVFHDPKSSESFFPYFSTGGRDDFIQYRYLQAVLGHWSDAAHNPVSSIYGRPMVDLEHAHVWAWDGRPWPDFPDRLETWADGTNHARGHWLNGRASVALAEVVAEVCMRCGLADIDVAELEGMVTGYLVEALEAGRQSLQPLMLTHAFDSFGRDGRLAFANRGRQSGVDLSDGGLVAREREPVISFTRAPAAETAERVTIGFVRGDLDYSAGAAEALAPDAAEPRSEQMALPLVLTDEEARAVADRALSESRIGRDGLACALPLSMLALTPGDIVRLEGAGGGLYRIDRLEDTGRRAVTAVRVEPFVYRRPILGGRTGTAPRLSAPTGVDAVFLDLPMLTGKEEPSSPHLAVTSGPWKGAAAVFSADDDVGYSFDREVKRPATIGTLLQPLLRGAPGLWMKAAVRVKVSGVLQSRSEAAVLNGANAAAVGNAVDGWEIIQFQTAELVAPREYLLSGLLRGQAGTDGIMPDVWELGTSFVLLDGAVGQVILPSAARGLERHYRVGPASRGYDDRSYRHIVEAFSGIGLRPYKPVHLQAQRIQDGGIELRWIRRTRVEGDSWLGREVPLGEESEAYAVRVLGSGGALVREAEAATSRHLYTAEEQAADRVVRPIAFEVAQVSMRYGVGPFERIEFNG